ncbi:hypothetical protein AB0D73_22720 [Streptomyces sp. NPDC048215]|uniref:hypothetical protein n=1 Tax=Streptomyces TaxID=1883 RepID=UPI002E106C6D|nr:hypothetical protein OG483_22865 [[Kitasatospora] papulosa]
MKYPLQPLIQPLGDGSAILYDRITTWITSPKYRDAPVVEAPPSKEADKAKGGKDKPKVDAPAEQPEPVLDKRAPLKRVGLVLGGAYIVASTDYTTYATAAAALGWVVAAYMVGTPDEPPAKAPQNTPAPTSETPRGAIVEWLTDAIGDRPGIHLYELYPLMLALPGMEKHDEAALREALVTLDIPITRAFTIGDVRGRSGVRLADLTAPLPSREEQPLSKGEDAGETACSTPEEEVKRALSSAEEQPAETPATA